MKLVGYNDLQARSAYQPTIQQQGDRWIAYIGHHGGTDDVPDPVNPLTGKAEPNGTSIVDVTDPAHPKYLASHSRRRKGNTRGGGAQMVRVCDGKSLPKGDPNARSTCCAPSAARRMKSGTSPIPPIPCSLTAIVERPEGHPQELVGMRHRHRLSRVGRARLALAPHDADLRPQRSRASREDPRLRPARPAARLDRRRADRAARRRSRPGRKATASISATAPTRAASCRSSTATSCSTGRRSRRRRICAIPRSRGCRCRP